MTKSLGLGCLASRSWHTSRALARKLAVVAAIGLVVVVADTPPARSQAGPVDGFADLVERVGPAVVNISTTREQVAPEKCRCHSFRRARRSRSSSATSSSAASRKRRSGRGVASLGSGFVIDPEGYVVTNNHVIAEADEITVQFADDHDYEAVLIGRDQQTDLALFKIERDEPFPFVEWADSDDVRVGDWMIAIGNPFGLGSTVTAGIVSARGRDIRAGPYDDFFQVDAPSTAATRAGRASPSMARCSASTPRSFRRPAAMSASASPFPSNLAQRVIDSLKADGRVARGWLGVRIQGVTDEIAESLGLDEAAAPWSPASPRVGRPRRPASRPVT